VTDHPLQLGWNGDYILDISGVMCDVLQVTRHCFLEVGRIGGI
jgi:hypothetical protein